MSALLQGLRPGTSGVQFTARTNLRVPLSSAGHTPLARRATDHSTGCSAGSKTSASSDGANAVVDPNLSVIEVEAKLREKVKGRYRDLQQGFQNYDIQQALSITRGEFRRVLEIFCFPMTSEQFDSVMHKVDVNPDGTVRYCDFLDKFYSTSRSASAPQDQPQQLGPQKYVRTESPKEMNTDMIEKMLKGKIGKNLKNVVKAFRLHDYNRDGHIQRHELRKVLENYCFRMTDQQFDKLYQRYDFHHRGTVNYQDILTRLGVTVDNPNQPPAEGSKAAMVWEQQVNGQDPKPAPQKPPPENLLAIMNFDQVEVEFRKKMKSNYGNLKRMFLAFDKNLDGFIGLEELKSILIHFTVPLNDQLFTQLMGRVGIKASGKVSWEYFLNKFQDPQGHANGQTIPIKASHKFSPIRGVNEKMDLQTVIQLLHEHVTNAYSSFKQAFLQLDKNRDGRISRKELKTIIENFKFDLTPGQFKELMIVLDPQHTNFISYHKFLDLFEEKETKEGHKWLKSCHRFNEHQRPAILAWDTVEGILRDKLTENWKDVSVEVVQADNLGTGRLAPKKLREILEKICLPLSDDHFNNLINRMKDRDEKGKVNYSEFFTRLGVSVLSGDLEGVSTQIHQDSEDTEQRRQADQVLRRSMARDNAQDRMGDMSPAEIVMRLKDRMAQQSTEIRKAFSKYDKSGKGKVSKADFRKIMEGFGMYLTDDQFRSLCSGLSFHNGHMTYRDFVKNFEDTRTDFTSSDQLVKRSNHRVNEIRGDQFGMSAMEVQAKLRSKLRENFEDLRGAFYKFDDDHNGILTKKNFRRMLDTFMCIMSDEEFEVFCSQVGIDKKSRISYQDFLEAFEVRDTEEGHKWLTSNHRYNEIKPMKLLTAEQVHSALAEKAHQQFRDLAKAFRTVDKSGNGLITKRDLRETLYKFMLPVNREQFNQLWTKYDREGKGHISHVDFLQQLTGQVFAPGDDAGTSALIVDNSQQRLEDHLESQQVKQEQITINQANRAAMFSVDQVIQLLRDRIREAHPNFYHAFKKYDKRQKGYLTVADLQKVLIDFSYFLDDDQFYDLLERC